MAEEYIYTNETLIGATLDGIPGEAVGPFATLIDYYAPTVGTPSPYTWTKPTRGEFVRIECIGGGGAGGGRPAPSGAGKGAGGGGGGYNYVILPLSTIINEYCVVVPVPENVDYTCSKAAKDSDGTISIVTDPEKMSTKLWAQVRQERNRLLTACDWTQLTDAPSINKAAWTTYRQALRDLPGDMSDPENVTWPTYP